MHAATGKRHWYPLSLGLAVGALLTGLVLPWVIDTDGQATGAGVVTDAAGEYTATSATPDGTDGAASPTAAGGDAPDGAATDPTAGADVVEQPSRPSTEEAPTASDVGVTAKSIKIGVLIADLGAAGRFGISVDNGDVDEQFRVFIDDVNARGGAHGRTVEAVYQHFDITSNDERHAACLALTEDHKVFAAVSGLGFFGPPVLCVTRDHGTPLVVSTDSSPEEYYTQARGLLFTELMNKHRILRVLAGELDAMGALRGHKIGIVDANLPADKTAVDGGLIPALQRLGYQVAHRETVSGDASVAASQMPLAAQQLRAADVDVLFTPMNIFHTALFVREADRQGYRPTYYGSDFAQGSGDLLLATMPDSYDGTLAFTSLRTGEHRTQSPEAPADAACRATYERATGTSLERASGPYQSMLSACGLIQLIERGVKAAGVNLTQPGFSVALRQQRGFTLPWFVGVGSFGSAKFDAADSIRTLRASMSCRCWLPAGEPHQARF